MEIVSQITWPIAFTVVASVVSIVVGLFGYLRSTKDKGATVQAVHDRVSILKDQLAALDIKIQVLRAKFEASQQSMTDHEARDIADFKALSDKVEKIMEIIVEMLREKP